MPGVVTARSAASLAALALCFSAGCQTRPSSPQRSIIQSFHGQLHYTAPSRSTVGETVVAVFSGGSFGLEFVSGPGFPLLKLHHDGNAAVAEGVFARGRWRGRAEAAPDQLKSWLMLRDVFDQAQTASRASGPVKLISPGARTWAADAEYSGQSLRSLRVVFPRTGERFSFRFAS